MSAALVESPEKMSDARNTVTPADLEAAIQSGDPERVRHVAHVLLIPNTSENSVRSAMELILTAPRNVQPGILYALTSWLSSAPQYLSEADKASLVLVAQQILGTPTTAEERFVAVDALGELGGPECVELLIDYLADDGDGVRMAATDGLARIDRTRLCILLPRLLEQETEELCRANLLAHRMGCEHTAFPEFAGWSWNAKALFANTAWDQVPLETDERVRLQKLAAQWLSEGPPSTFVPSLEVIAVAAAPIITQLGRSKSHPPEA